MVVETHYIMGVAKAALECAVRYMAAELGPKGSASCHLSRAAGDVGCLLASRVRRASGDGEGEVLLKLWSASTMPGLPRHFWPICGARLITGSTLYVDGGYHIID